MLRSIIKARNSIRTRGVATVTSTPLQTQQRTTSDMLVQAAEATSLGVYGKRTSNVAKIAPLESTDIEGNTKLDMTCGIGVYTTGLVTLTEDDMPKIFHTSNLVLNKESVELSNALCQMTAHFGGLGIEGTAKGKGVGYDVPGAIGKHSVPVGLRVFLCNSGAEANEGALKFIKKHGNLTGKKKIVSFANSFHGRTLGALSATWKEAIRAPFYPLVPGFVQASFNDIESINEVIDEDTCGVIVEPIQGEGGVGAASEEFLRALRKRTSEVGALLAYDEIQCGIFRTGPQLWAHSNLDVDCHPDIVTSAKALGGGAPIGAIVYKQSVEDSLNAGDHGTTFGGNAFAAAMALKQLSRLASQEGLSDFIATRDLAHERCHGIIEKFPDLVNPGLRGAGLMLGLQMAKEDDLPRLVSAAASRDLMVLSSGQGVLRMLLPILGAEDRPKLSRAYDILEEALAGLR